MMITLTFLMALFCFFNGVQEFYLVLTNWKATEMSCEEYIEKGSSAKWLKLNNCYIDNEKVIAVYNQKTINENSDFFIPVYSDTYNYQIFEPSVKIFLKVNSKRQKAIFSKSFNLHEDDKKFKEYFSNNIRDFEFLTFKDTTSIKGKVLFGVQCDERVRNLLKKEEEVSPNFIIIDENEEPSVFSSLWWIFGGLFSGFLSFLFSSFEEDNKP